MLQILLDIKLLDLDVMIFHFYSYNELSTSSITRLYYEYYMIYSTFLRMKTIII